MESSNKLKFESFKSSQVAPTSDKLHKTLDKLSLNRWNQGMKYLTPSKKA